MRLIVKKTYKRKYTQGCKGYKRQMLPIVTDTKYLIGCSSIINKMKDHLQNSRNIIILGNPGSGKTIVPHLICGELGLNVLDVHKDNISHIDTFMKNITIESFFDQRKKVVMFDNIEYMFQCEKITVSFMIALLRTTNIPIIITCNRNEEKKILDLKKYANLITLSCPTPLETATYISSVCKRSPELLGVGKEVNMERLQELAKQHGGNIRETFTQYINGTRNNDISQFRNMNTLERVDILLTTRMTGVDLSYLIDGDANIVSCTFYENLPDEIHFNRCPKSFSAALRTYKDICEYFIASTLMEQYMCDNFEWGLWDTVYMVRFMGAQYALNNVLHVNNKRMPLDVLRLSQVLSKISHKQIMRKRMRTFGLGLIPENMVILADTISSNMTEKQRKETLSADECNFINTFVKYF